MRIAYIPDNLVGVNQTSDFLSAAMLAREFDQIVVKFPAPANKDAMARTLAVIETCTKPVWAIPHSYVDYTGMQPADHKKKTEDTIDASMEVIANLLGVNIISTRLLGFAFEDFDYSRPWGDALFRATSTPSDQNPFRVDRSFINNLVTRARKYGRPAMMICKNPSDLLSTVYRSSDSDIPGAAAWPSILGTDSSKTDWVVVKNPVYVPQNDILNNSLITPLAYDFFGLSNLATAKVHRTNNIKIGALQEYSFHSMNPDFLIGQFFSDDEKAKLQGFSTLMDLLGLDSWGIKPITHPSVPFVISKFILDSISNLKYPSAGERVILYSMNGVLHTNHITNNVSYDSQFTQELNFLGQTAISS